TCGQKRIKSVRPDAVRIMRIHSGASFLYDREQSFLSYKKTPSFEAVICAGASQIALTALTANASEWRKNMLNVGKIEEGFVLDHIKAGKSMSIYHHLQLDKLDCPVAIIKNARSNKMGKKDILKVECEINTLDLDVLAVIDHNI